MNVFGGLTENQISAAEEILFLESVEDKDKELKKSMNEVDELLHRVSGSYTLKQPAIEPVPDSNYSKMLNESKEEEVKLEGKLLKNKFKLK